MSALNSPSAFGIAGNGIPLARKALIRGYNCRSSFAANQVRFLPFLLSTTAGIDLPGLATSDSARSSHTVAGGMLAQTRLRRRQRKLL